jgi:hypothetical protein
VERDGNPTASEATLFGLRFMPLLGITIRTLSLVIG